MTSGARQRLRAPLGMFRVAGLTAFLLGVVSCGQTGPLTLPGPATPASTEAAPPADAAPDEEDQTEQDER
jgi:predicted small lipoprotein YifL